MTAPGTDVLPQDTIDKIKNYLNKVSGKLTQNFEAVIKEIQAILGSRPAVQQEIAAWNQVATPLGSASSSLDQALVSAKSNWSGSAGQGFIQYVSDAKGVVDNWKSAVSSNSTAAGGFVSGLNAASTAIDTIYQGMLAAINKLEDGIVTA